MQAELGVGEGVVLAEFVVLAQYFPRVFKCSFADAHAYNQKIIRRSSA